MEYIGVRAVRAFGESNERMSTTSFAATVAQRGEKVQCLHNVLGQFHPTAANISELGCANIEDTSQYVLEEWAKRWTCFDKQQPGRVITLKAVTSETSSIKKVCSFSRRQFLLKGNSVLRAHFSSLSGEPGVARLWSRW